MLDYAATHPDAVIHYYASDMVLHVDSDTAYLVMPNAPSHLAGHFYHSDMPSSAAIPTSPKLNGPMNTECKIIRSVDTSAADAETGALFHNCQMAITIRQALIVLKHSQPPTPLKTDNTTAYGYTTTTIKQKKSKSWDMTYHWLQNRQTSSKTIPFHVG